MRSMRELMIAFDNGDQINDAELEHMRQRLTAAEKELAIISYTKYSLMLLDIRLKIEAVGSYQRARNEKY